MNSLTLRTPWLCALFTVAAAWSPVIAAAQDCTNDADCGAGYRCQTDSYESCGGTITCTPDGECTEMPGDCETVTYSWCTNATCTDDAGCPSHMACQAQTTWQCDGGGAGSGSAGAGGAAGSSPPRADAGACAPGEMCPTEEPSCVEVPADSLCIPRYQLPCTVASDCGGGFDCIQSSYWECDGTGMGGGDTDGGVATAGTGAVAPIAGASGGAGSGADGGVPPAPSECHEVPSTDYYCQLQELPCSADSECPDGMKCLDQYIWTCTGGGAAGSGSGTAGSGMAGAGRAGSGASGGAPAPGDMAMDADAGAPDGSECTTDVQQRCMPPEYAGGGPGGGTGTGGMSGGGSADAGVDDDAPGDPGSGSAGAGGAGDSGGGPASGGGDGESDDDHDRGHHFGWLKLGCSAGGPIGGDPLGWIALGMVALVLRRRARRG